MALRLYRMPKDVKMNRKLKTISDIRSIFEFNDTIYVGLELGADRKSLWLKHKDKNIPIQPFKPEEVRYLKDCLDPKSNLTMAVSHIGKKTASEPFRASINQLEDWFVEGYDTIQIELNRDGAPFLMTLPEELTLERRNYPLAFKAKIASHRAHASLVVNFTDLDTGLTEKKEVLFNPEFIGGKVSGRYQNVIIPAPEKSKRTSARISINFLGTSEPESKFSPFVFLADICLEEGEAGWNDELPAFTEEDLSYEWVSAKLVDRKAFDCIFVGLKDKIEVFETKEIENTRAFFSEQYYLNHNPDVDFDKIDPFTHYLLYGRKEFRNPGPEFSVREYYLRHPDIEAARFDPLVHYANKGKAEQRSLGPLEEKLQEIWRRTGRPIPNVDPDLIVQRMQDFSVPLHLTQSRKLAVFVTPEHNAMSGGIYSIFSIADQARRLRRKHGYDVVVMTRPNAANLTYIRNSAFRNSETVLRFEQLRLFSEVSELQLHIPEYATIEFVRNLSPEMVRYLARRDHLHINILNQNTRLMPDADAFRDLRRFADSIGQSVSHHAFFGQKWADTYRMPISLLPAYTDLSPYPPAGFREKENLIIYSDDEAPYRSAVLKRLQAMGDYSLVKIKGVHFDNYMELATRCRFSVSFGEGFDGYIAQPIYQGGIGFALYTDEFFPDDSYRKFENFFDSEEQMIDQVVPTIRRLESNQKRYEALNRALRAKWDEIYNLDDYIVRIERLMRMEYDIRPSKSAL